MKVGDLVMLSAYGTKRKRAEWIDRGDVGIILSIRKYDRNQYPDDYKVLWARSDWSKIRRTWTYDRCNTRSDLKYVK